MNNTWEQYQYSQTQALVPQLMPSMGMLDMNTNSAPVITQPPLIGPVRPEDMENQNMNVDIANENNGDEASKSSRDRDRERRSSRDRSDRARNRSRRSRDRYERSNKSRSENQDSSQRTRDRDRRNRRTKWDSDTAPLLPTPELPTGTMMMSTATMMPFSNVNMMGQQDFANIQNMQGIANMQGMTNMPNMQGIPNMPNVQGMPNMSNMHNAANIYSSSMMPNMMGNMMDPQMMMMNQQMMSAIPNQAIYIGNIVMLPPLPGSSLPNRREKPSGCRTILVGGLPKGITENVISEIFQRFGNISEVKLSRTGVCHVRFESADTVEQSFMLSGYRIRFHDQIDTEAITIFVDYALNREDQAEYERSQRNRDCTPPRIEPYTAAGLASVTDMIKSEDKFIEAAPTLAVWLERGECNKKNANIFYSLIQATNNQVRRLYSEKMTLDDEYANLKSAMREKFALIVTQFEQVAKILTAAKHQRVSDHFTKQQRRNIETWLKLTEELDNIKDEFNANFDDYEVEKVCKNVVPLEKYEALKLENENLTFELEGYKNEAHLAKDEAERKFEKFKAHFIAQQALQGNKQAQVFPPLPPMNDMGGIKNKPQPPPPTPDDNQVITSGLAVPPSEAKLISILTLFLVVHPLGATLDYLVSYIRSMVPNVTQATVLQVLQKYSDVFCRHTKGIGVSMEHRWGFVTFDVVKSEANGM